MTEHRLMARRTVFFVAIVSLLSLESGQAQHAIAARPPAGRQVAITFDDVPFLPETESGSCDAALARSDNDHLIELIAQHRIPATALVVSGRRCGSRPGVILDLVRSWVEARIVLGNHTFTHPDLEMVTLDSYTADIVRGLGMLDELEPGLAGTPRYFRAPLLHMGSTPEKFNGLKKFLSHYGYVVAPVTIDNQEWVYAAAYAQSLRRADSVKAARVVDAYIAHMKDSFEFYERMSQALFGREIPQVLLVHANQLNVDHMDRLVGMMKQRGYTFVSLDQVLQDSAYRSADTYIGSRGLSWLKRWAITRGVPVEPEPREVAWVASLAGEQ